MGVNRSRKGIDWDAQPLGEVSDSELARRHGVTQSVVTHARNRRHIPPYEPPDRWADVPLGEMLDKDLAELLGVNVKTLTGARQRRGIKAYRARSSKADPQLARAIMDALPKIRPDTIPVRHLALMLFLGDHTRTLKQVAKGLGLGQTTAASLINQAEAAGRVVTGQLHEARQGPPAKVVKLAPRGLREMSRRRKKTPYERKKA